MISCHINLTFLIFQQNETSNSPTDLSIVQGMKSYTDIIYLSLIEDATISRAKRVTGNMRKAIFR